MVRVRDLETPPSEAVRTTVVMVVTWGMVREKVELLALAATMTLGRLRTPAGLEVRVTAVCELTAAVRLTVRVAVAGPTTMVEAASVKLARTGVVLPEASTSRGQESCWLPAPAQRVYVPVFFTLLVFRVNVAGAVTEEGPCRIPVPS